MCIADVSDYGAVIIVHTEYKLIVGDVYTSDFVQIIYKSGHNSDLVYLFF